jgi:hypothetical protein
MSWMIWLGVGAVVVVVWLLVSRGGKGGRQKDLGTVSGQWINEHRLQGRQPTDRY